ncbi:very-long-chain (3R)-3-hydroxyacyl-CoA dehydratase 4 [Genypterus blacodes]|uniref:very-long-chain (3R)-3-hydroxyacyl-CoA dehydratase 4 n=1 Tax=Genypterus blacodes TaxID=154954 RepID=UPI003F76E95D
MKHADELSLRTPTKEHKRELLLESRAAAPVPAGILPECYDSTATMFSVRLAYIFIYNLFQFCSHTWILANISARFLSFGRDALADTFYSVGVVMSLCQLISILELFHIADGLEKARLFPRLFQILERHLLLILVIMLEEVQSKPIMCVQFLLWNILDLLRYPHELLCVMATPSLRMLWTRYTLGIPMYVLSAAIEGMAVYKALPYLQPTGSNSFHLDTAGSAQIRLPSVLMAYLPLLAVGVAVTAWQLVKEREERLDKWNKKLKRK